METFASAAPSTRGSIPPMPTRSCYLSLSVLLLLLTFRLAHADLSGKETRFQTDITAVAELSNPAKLARLKGERSANSRLLKIMAWLEEARRDGYVPSKTIDEAQRLNGDSGPHAELVKESLLRNHDIATFQGCFTPENMIRLKSGKAPISDNGSGAGAPVEVDHVFPVDEIPALGNELANLWLLPRTLNRRKSDAIRQRAIDLGQKMVAAHLMTPAQFETMKKLR